MHPALIILPALGLIIGPRIWVNRVLDRYDVSEDRPDNAQEVARDLLDRHGLQSVAVELTELGDHYDPDARAVRLSRRTFDNTSLTAITVAAHEVAHAQQHSSRYPLFIWRNRLARVAEVTGMVGTVLIVAVPLAHLLTGRRLPPSLAGTAAVGVLGTAAATHLVALPTELDASFRRAVPMLRQGLIADTQIEDARRILFACSLTYAAASFAGFLHFLPWLGRGVVPFRLTQVGIAADSVRSMDQRPRSRPVGPAAGRQHRSRLRGGTVEAGLRRVLKPVLRRWLLAGADTQHRTRRVVRDTCRHGSE